MTYTPINSKRLCLLAAKIHKYFIKNKLWCDLSLGILRGDSSVKYWGGSDINRTVARCRSIVAMKLERMHMIYLFVEMNGRANEFFDFWPVLHPHEVSA